jgi:hypothetical protein
MLETGINLRQITPQQDRDSAMVSKVTSVLRALGVAA